MLEENGRFMRRKEQNSIQVRPDGLSIDGVEVISLRKAATRNRFEICETIDSGGDVSARERLAKIARCLNEGRQVEAIFLATMTKWCLKPSTQNEIKKANFNPAEPRDHGRWTEGLGQSDLPKPIETIQYRGYFHDFVLNDLLKGLSARGSIVLKNIPVLGINGVVAIPDGASLPLGATKPYFIEMKTGFDAEFTANQQRVYRLICIGGHAVSFDPRIRQLGLIPGAPLPPMDIMIAHTYGPGLPLHLHNYCKDFLE